MGDTLKINEIFHSLQGESSRAGLPTVFIRLSGCSLRCDYCDTQYAWDDGEFKSVEGIIEAVSKLKWGLVEITGGEPMEQENTPLLARRLVEEKYMVMIETNGAHDISSLPEEVIKIVDIKCPDSGAEGSFLKSNLAALNNKDEIKFVISSRKDYEWVLERTAEWNLFLICTVNLSPTEGKVEPQTLAQWIIESGLPFRLNLQLHKIWRLP